MRIDSVDLVRFGHFTNRLIDLPLQTPDYCVIYGDNEAGKSTLLRGISALFFGVPARTVDAHSCKTSELRIGATISDGGKVFSFRRRKGTTGTVLTPNEGQLSEANLAGFLRELDRDRFEQFFGLTHQRLREGGEELLRGKGDVGSALFQAAGLLDLRNLLEKLDAEAKELFSPKSRSKFINCAIDGFRQAKSETRRLAISAPAVKQKQAELDSASERHDARKAESESLLAELVRLRRIANNKPDVARLRELRESLRAFESVPLLPVGVRKERDESVAALADATDQIRVLTNHIRDRTERIGALHVESALQAYANEIGELNSETNDYHRSVNDRPKRVNERGQAMERAEAEWRRIWTRHPIADAERLRAPYSKKREIFTLIKDHARLCAESEQAQEQARTVDEDQDRLREELKRHTDPGDPVRLIATIAQARSLGDVDQAIARLKSEIERLDASANRDLKKLRGWSGSVHDLETGTVPSPATIDRYAVDWARITDARKGLKSRLLEESERIRANQMERDRLGENIGGVGESDLAEVRGERDRLWQLIYSSMFERTVSPEEAQRQSGESSPLAENFAVRVRVSDEIADARFANAKDVAVHDRLAKEIEIARTDRQRVSEELERLEIEDGDLRREWADEWQALTGGPRLPAEMREWMQLRQTILGQLEQRREKEEELSLLVERATLASGQVSANLAPFEPGLGQGNDSLTILLKIAEGIASSIQERRRANEGIRLQLQLLSPEKLRAKLDDYRSRLADWAVKWSVVVNELQLPERHTPEQVEDAIAVLEKVFGHLKDAETLQDRINKITANVVLFEDRVSRLVASTDPSLSSRAPDAAVTELHQRLVRTGNAETEKNALEEQNARDDSAIANYRNKVQRAETSLKKLMELANCSSVSQLDTTIAASEQKADKREEYERIAQGLIERNADPDLGQIEAEASEHQLDSLRTAILSGDNRQKELQDEVFNAGVQYATLLREYEALQSSDESTRQAQKAEDALARIRPAVAQYLRLQLASEVLQRAIESYREKHQGPVLNRASEIFCNLTLNEYRGLTTGFGENDKSVLVAVRKSKENVEVDGLSDGTRDQLYFALRLAAIEHHVETVSPCPVILDDILINSDDRRASATLKILSDLAKRTQVLFFTHHRHLAELGCEAGAQIIDLDASLVAAHG